MRVFVIVPHRLRCVYAARTQLFIKPANSTSGDVGAQKLLFGRKMRLTLLLARQTAQELPANLALCVFSCVTFDFTDEISVTRFHNM